MTTPNNNFQKTLKSFKALTLASMKMYFRNRGAVVFTLILPLVLLSVFAFLSRGSRPRITVVLTNHATTELSRNFVDDLKGIQAMQIKELSEDEAAADL